MAAVRPTKSVPDEEAIALLKRLYQQQGWLIAATSEPTEVNKEGFQTTDEFMSHYRWRVIGIATREEMLKQYAAINVLPHELLISRPYFCRVEAMD